MIRVGVLSDSHGDWRRIREAVSRLSATGPLDGLLHLGDGAREFMRDFAGKAPVTLAVRGNCDVIALPEERFVDFGDVTILMTHGHTYHVKLNLDVLASRAQVEGARAALFGHTHEQYAGFHSGVLMLNPGACKDGKYALITIHQGLITPQLFG